MKSPTPEQIQTIPRMLIGMYNLLDEEFVISTAQLALTDQNVYNLMLRWHRASLRDCPDIEKEIQKYIDQASNK